MVPPRAPNRPALRDIRIGHPLYAYIHRRLSFLTLHHIVSHYYTQVFETTDANGVTRIRFRRNSSIVPQANDLHRLQRIRWAFNLLSNRLQQYPDVQPPPSALSPPPSPPLAIRRVVEFRNDEDSNRNNAMYQPDQNRNDAQGMHFHVHQCVCTSPLYGPYRPPMLAPYVAPPVPRPYNLAHYQYTSYNIPYNVPIFNSNAIVHPTPPTVPIMPEAVERRCDTTDSVRAVVDDLDDYISSANDANTESFTKFLEQGCVAAEKIAIRNQHRPCFKNIQNLCNRTKNEILKPSHTVSNIHSQGIPWATKDFIYAYVRLINCWHMLKGYLQAKEGTLGNIDRELTAEFKTCYAVWESNTKDLAEHMIKIFSNLDNNVSNPTAAPSAPFANRPRTRGSTTVMDQGQQTGEAAASSPQQDDTPMSDTTTEPSPREEESDSEGRVYMKPGSYNVPKKNNSSDNLSQSIEFFETAKNISTHYKKMEARKYQMEVSPDKEWKNAITASTSLIKKNSTFEEEVGGVTRSLLVPANGTMLNDVEYIRRWLYNNDDYDGKAYDLRMGLQERPVTLLQRTKDDILKFGEGSSSQTERGYETMKLILDELEGTEFRKTLQQETSSIPDSANMQYILRKYNCRFYKNPAAMVEDIRDLVSNAQTFFTGNAQIYKQAEEFCVHLDAAIERYMPHYDELAMSLDGNKS